MKRLISYRPSTATFFEHINKLIRGFGFYAYFFLLINIFAGVGLANAAAATAKPAKVVLLLHGLASDLKTWNKLVDSQSGFDGRCKNTRDSNFSTSKLARNSDGVYCMRFTFGGKDRIDTAPKGLDGSICSQSGGCSGDYSTFDTLAEEINNEIRKIKRRLGSDVRVVLLGHSRGGLAARAFLQGDSTTKANVVGFISTGTPHAGSQLGRYYNYMEKNCLPESDYTSAFDTSDCANDWRFSKAILDEVGGLDVKAPSFGFLSDASFSIKSLNSNVNNLPAIKFTQISYNNIEFGCLGGSLGNSESDCGFDIFTNPSGPSDPALDAVLAGRNRDELLGDGIVPIFSQKMNRLEGWVHPIKSYGKVKRIHTEEPKQILDISRALTNIYRRLGWKT